MTRVLMISRQSMFEQGLDALLRQEPGLEIVICETDVGIAMECLKELRPDVVIFEANGPEADVGQIVRHLLRENSKLKVIELNLRDNTVCIYRCEQRMIKQVKDLLQFIQVEGFGE
jgi:DNA-binding NarL/FixJ family response regulator